MQRYAGVAWNEPRADGEWVKYTDAMEEKSKYGKASFDNGFSAGAAKEREAREEARKQGAAEEREVIIKVLIDLYHEMKNSGWENPLQGFMRDVVIPSIRSRGEEPRCTCGISMCGNDGHYPDCPCYKLPEVKPLERFNYDVIDSCFKDKLNALVDAVNKILKERK